MTDMISVGLIVLTSVAIATCNNTQYEEMSSGSAGETMQARQSIVVRGYDDLICEFQTLKEKVDKILDKCFTKGPDNKRFAYNFDMPVNRIRIEQGIAKSFDVVKDKNEISTAIFIKAAGNKDYLCQATVHDSLVRQGEDETACTFLKVNVDSISGKIDHPMVIAQAAELGAAFLGFESGLVKKYEMEALGTKVLGGFDGTIVANLNEEITGMLDTTTNLFFTTADKLLTYTYENGKAKLTKITPNCFRYKNGEIRRYGTDGMSIRCGPMVQLYSNLKNQKLMKEVILLGKDIIHAAADAAEGVVYGVDESVQMYRAVLDDKMNEVAADILNVGLKLKDILMNEVDENMWVLSGSGKDILKFAKENLRV